MTQPAGTEGQQQAQGAPAGQQQQQQTETPPWGEDFDAEKAWKLVQGLRADKEKLAARPVLDDATKTALAEYEKLKAANQTELEKTQGEVTRWQSDAEKWRSTAVASKVEALAAADFISVADAVKSVDPSKYLDAGGAIDEAAIKADLAKVLEDNPHYRRAEGTQTPRTPRPNAAQGSGVNGRSASDPATEFAAILNGQLTK